MTIYGYTLLNTEGFWGGKETNTYLFTDVNARNEAMYMEYAILFNDLILSQGMEEDMYSREFLARDWFMPNIEDGECVGLIQMSDYHIQFEPFTKEI